MGPKRLIPLKSIALSELSAIIATVNSNVKNAEN